MPRASLRESARQHLLGDRINDALQHTPIPRIVQALERATGWNCGCARRTAALNRWHAARGQPNRKG